MDFDLTDEHCMLKDLVRRFVDTELIPLEPAILQREAAVAAPALTADEQFRIDGVSRAMGLWGSTRPRMSAGSTCAVAMVGVNEEMGRTITLYTLPPDSPNLRILAATVIDHQRDAYLAPMSAGSRTPRSAFRNPVRPPIHPP